MIDTLRDIPIDKGLLRIPGNSLESRTLSTHSLTSNRDKIGKTNENIDRDDKLATLYLHTSPSKQNVPTSLSISAHLNKPKSTVCKNKINMTLTQNRFISENFSGINKAWNQTSQNFGKTSFNIFGKPETTKIDENEMRVGTHILRNIYEEDVKQLDNWQIEIKKKKLLKSGIKYKDMLKPISRADEHSNVMFPSINAHAIDRILKDSDDEEELRRHNKGENVVNQIRLMVNFESNGKIGKERGGLDTHANLEFRVKEGKEDIARDLVIKKLKEHIKDYDYETINSEYFQNKMQAVAKSALVPFKCLRGTLVSTNVEQCVKFVTENRGHGQEEPKRISKKNKLPQESQTTELIINYKDIEEMLNKDLERINEIINGYDCRKSYLNRQINKLSKEIKYYEEQLEKLSEASTPSELDLPSPKMNKKTPTSNLSNQKARSSMLKMKIDLKQQKIELMKKLEELGKKLFVKNNEVQSVDQDLKTAKENRVKFKLQLRDLYQDLLKDEAYLIKSNNNLSYSWVLHSLWDLNQEADGSAFPTFLDQESVFYIIEYAKVQYVLIQYCQENRLFENILDLEEFKEGSSKEIASLIIHKNPRNRALHTTLRPEYSTVTTKSRNLHSILEDFRDRMKQIKAENLKMKEPVNATQTKLKSSRAPIGLKYWDCSQMKSVVLDQKHHLTGEGSSSSKIISKKENFINESLEKEPKIVAHRLLKELEKMKENEKQRLIKKHLSRNSDAHEKELLQKSLIFLFGKLEGEEIFSSLQKEQRLHVQRFNTKDASSGKSTSGKSSTSQMRKLTILTQPLNSSAYNNAKTSIFTSDQSAPLIKSNFSPFEITKASSAQTGFLPNKSSNNLHLDTHSFSKSISASIKNNAFENMF